jgi:hypothetical protein
MRTTPTRKRFITGAVGAAIAGMAAPALLFLGAGTAQAVPVSERGPVAIIDGSLPNVPTINTHRQPGHVSIKAVPPLVSPPLVWGAFDSPAPIVGD